MTRSITSLAVVAGFGLAAATSTQASPMGAGAAVGNGRTIVPAAQVLPVQWQNVCRERIIIRRDARGRIQQYQLPMCTPVWVGRRYFRDGLYYADPSFLAPL